MRKEETRRLMQTTCTLTENKHPFFIKAKKENTWWMRKVLLCNFKVKSSCSQKCSVALLLSATRVHKHTHAHNRKIKAWVDHPDLGRWFFGQTAGAAMTFSASHWGRRYKSLDFSGNAPHGATGMELQKLRGWPSISHLPVLSHPSATEQTRTERRY